jgi:DNA repair and recombination RAD54-like protein
MQIEEKIFQRQCHKQLLSSAVVDEEETARHFSQDNLRALFTLNTDTMCETHDTYRCRRCFKGHQVSVAPPGVDSSDMSNWNHFSALDLTRCTDVVLREQSRGLATFVFQQKSHEL